MSSVVEAVGSSGDVAWEGVVDGVDLGSLE